MASPRMSSRLFSSVPRRDLHRPCRRVGLRDRDVQWKIVMEMLLAWLVTLPVSALLDAGAQWALG